MCLELYSPDQPIQIQFSEEVIEFDGPRAFHSLHTVLVRNTGYEPISTLHLLYPRPLLDVQYDPVTDEPTPSLSRVEVWTQGFPDGVRFQGVPGTPMVSLKMADPNYPVCNLPTLEGYWDPANYSGSNLASEVVVELDECAIQFFRYRFSAWTVSLHPRSIGPGESHWLRWRIRVDDVGESVARPVAGAMVFHEVASPIDVHRTVTEGLLTGLRDLALTDDPQPEDTSIIAALNAILDGHHLRRERRVDIQYYELSIVPGDSDRHVLSDVIQQGDIRMRSGSPRLLEPDEYLYPHQLPPGVSRPIYEWKSGSILEPAHPWRNSGFSLRFNLVLG